MRSLKDIEKLVKRFHIKPSSTMQNQTLTEALKTQEELNAQKETEVSLNIWRIAATSRVAKFSIAAVIIIAAVGSSVIGGKNSGRATQRVESGGWDHQRHGDRKLLGH